MSGPIATQVKSVSVLKKLFATLLLTMGIVGLIAGIWLWGTHFLRTFARLILGTVFSGSSEVAFGFLLMLFGPWTLFMLSNVVLSVFCWRKIASWRSANIEVQFRVTAVGVFLGGIGGVTMAWALHTYYLT